ncbi:hypothetical protein B7755_022295 [Streptomyces sp. NBS 14/10]|uniref:hypothetical protein n=1 Tax=Streptomyces sp. NBS 14/10 TaxID=1945643 RepID=UPI00211B5AB8|nr:hypothetical protein [Streptomyces sp. NBS 14/10]KAK1180630.1 hypothetical protein B7755_022295 [Streptomyces sp. NBS 14/10]
MEQRIGPSTPPVPAAGFDPAYIPGITAPRPDEPKEAAEPSPEDAVPDEAAVAADDVDAVDDERAESADAAEEDTAEAETADAEAKAEDGDEEEADGPDFKASDHRGSISAGRRGVTLLLDGETAEFDWSEIGAVEIDTPRFGRRFSVTVYTTARRWYSADIAASSRKSLKEWTTELDAVLDTYFEDTKPEDTKAKDKAEPEDAEPEKTEPEDAESSDTESEATEPSDAKS